MILFKKLFSDNFDLKRIFLFPSLTCLTNIPTLIKPRTTLWKRLNVCRNSTRSKTTPHRQLCSKRSQRRSADWLQTVLQSIRPKRLLFINSILKINCRTLLHSVLLSTRLIQLLMLAFLLLIVNRESRFFLIIIHKQIFFKKQTKNKANSIIQPYSKTKEQPTNKLAVARGQFDTDWSNGNGNVMVWLDFLLLIKQITYINYNRSQKNNWSLNFCHWIKWTKRLSCWHHRLHQLKLVLSTEMLINSWLKFFPTK